MFKVIYLFLFIVLISATAFALREYERCEDKMFQCLGEYTITIRDNIKYLYDKLN